MKVKTMPRQHPRHLEEAGGAPSAGDVPPASPWRRHLGAQQTCGQNQLHDHEISLASLYKVLINMLTSQVFVNDKAHYVDQPYQFFLWFTNQSKTQRRRKIFSACGISDQAIQGCNLLSRDACCSKVCIVEHMIKVRSQGAFFSESERQRFLIYLTHFFRAYTAD